MSIAIVAPEKFDFQDIVCVDMMLRFHEKKGMQLLVEPANGEDGELIFCGASPFERAEIQVKGAAGAATIDTIAGCLTHMPPRKSSDTLLERLLGDPKRLVILVLSGRCNDAASVYSVPFTWSGTSHPDGRLKNCDVTSLIQAFATHDHPKTGLKTKREAHCKSVAASVDRAALKVALHRLIVLERLDEVELESRCADRLRMVHRIPGDRIPDVLARLRKAVKEAKKQHVDAVPLFRSLLAKATPPPTRPQDYVLRGDEATWAATLSRENVLLLSGPPRVGKSDAARWVAAEYEEFGYEIVETNDVDNAERVLLEPGDALRLCHW